MFFHMICHMICHMMYSIHWQLTPRIHRYSSYAVCVYHEVFGATSGADHCCSVVGMTSQQPSDWCSIHGRRGPYFLGPSPIKPWESNQQVIHLTYHNIMKKNQTMRIKSTDHSWQTYYGNHHENHLKMPKIPRIFVHHFFTSKFTEAYPAPQLNPAPQSWASQRKLTATHQLLGLRISGDLNSDFMDISMVISWTFPLENGYSKFIWFIWYETPLPSSCLKMRWIHFPMAYLFDTEDSPMDGE